MTQHFKYPIGIDFYNIMDITWTYHDIEKDWKLFSQHLLDEEIKTLFQDDAENNTVNDCQNLDCLDFSPDNQTWPILTDFLDCPNLTYDGFPELIYSDDFTRVLQPRSEDIELYQVIGLEQYLAAPTLAICQRLYPDKYFVLLHVRPSEYTRIRTVICPEERKVYDISRSYRASRGNEIDAAALVDQFTFFDASSYRPDQKFWRYFDFDENWQQFLRIWKTEPVQRVLDEHMEIWCTNQAYFENMPDGSYRRPSWNRSTPLWRLSRTDYWHNKITKTLHDNTQAEHRWFVDGLRRAGLKRKLDEDDTWRMYIKQKSDMLYERNSPRKDSIDSFIMRMGKNYLHSAFVETARIMFPDEHIIEMKSDNLDILLCNRKMVFDIFGFYHEKYDGDQMLKSDAIYDDSPESDEY